MMRKRISCLLVFSSIAWGTSLPANSLRAEEADTNPTVETQTTEEATTEEATTEEATADEWMSDETPPEETSLDAFILTSPRSDSSAESDSTSNASESEESGEATEPSSETVGSEEAEASETGSSLRKSPQLNGNEGVNRAPVEHRTPTSRKNDANGTDETGTRSSTSEATEPALTPELRALRDRIRRCLASYYFKHENTNDHSPWGLMHAFISYGVETQIVDNNQRVNACSFLAGNGMSRGLRMMYLEDNRLQMRVGPGVQGHPGQFLAMLAQSRVQRTYPLLVQGRELSVEDLIEYEKLTCRPKTELTFKLIGLTHYLDLNAQWKSNDGQDWSIPRLIKEELAQPVIGAACGGTHRLTGLTYAVKKRERKGEPMDGQWLRAKKYLDAYHDYTFSLQNPDGSFSTDWFRGGSNWGDEKRRLETTGHILEWLVVSLPKEQLTDPRFIRATHYLTNLLLENSEIDWAIGPKGHALHALALVDERLFGLTPGKRVSVYVSELRKRPTR